MDERCISEEYDEGEMKKTSLKEIATITAGQSAPKPELFSNEGLPFVRAGSLEDLIAGKKESDLELISNDVAKELRMNLYPEGSILFAKSGMSATKNRFYQLKTPAYVVSHLAVLIPKDHFFSDYLRHVLIKYPPSSLIKDLAYPAISLGDIENFKVPVPEDFDDQIRIATLLSKVENLISRRRDQLRQLDELLKSVFLEMFGDPVRNEKGWEIRRVDEISDSRLGKMRDKKFITGNHLRKYIGNSNVQWFRFKLDDLEEMDFDERERALFALMDGDLLICEGGDIGRCAIWRNNLTECYFQKAMHRVRLHKSQAIPEGNLEKVTFDTN